MPSIESPAWAEHPDLVAFYRQHRNHPDDLYPSERRFLPWLARHATSVLDAGCASWGFSDIWRHYQSGIVYTGVDLSEALMQAARSLHPHDTFLRGDVTQGMTLPDRCATVVQALGWLHWEPRYREALAELWRVTDRYLFFDVRLHDRPARLLHGVQHLTFDGPWDGQTSTPYLILPWERLARELLALRPRTILGYGYWGDPASTVTGVRGRVCFATFVLERGTGAQSRATPLVCIDLPLAWPAALSHCVVHRPGSQLDDLLALDDSLHSQREGAG